MIIVVLHSVVLDVVLVFLETLVHTNFKFIFQLGLLDLVKKLYSNYYRKYCDCDIINNMQYNESFCLVIKDNRQINDNNVTCNMNYHEYSESKQKAKKASCFLNKSR